jgi:hypothetical protein
MSRRPKPHPAAQASLFPIQTGSPLKEAFDPTAMEALAKQMIQEGTMPSQQEWESALERIRQEFVPKILKARERDRQEK